VCIVLHGAGPGANAQVKQSQERETDPLVLKKLEWFQDMKFGLLMHWGPYSQWGVVESWSLCPEDEGWCQKKGPLAGVYAEYKRAYENLKTSFNPVKFDPAAWASAAKAAGMRYVVFTTKHHDGFCMFDSKQTDYKITDKDCPLARSLQPGLIVLDRAVPGRYENYHTPEQEVPEKPPDYVWETCMTMATSWSYVPDDTYKPTRKLVHLLVDVVAKGGNFLLNIGPSPEGELPPVSLDRLRDIGDWMRVNGGAIYSSRPLAPYVGGTSRLGNVDQT